MTVVTTQRMTVDEFLTWSSGREGHWELFGGNPVAMSPERAIHGRTIYKVANALERAIQAANTDGHVLLDSVMVRIDQHTSFQPDVLVYCGPRVSDDALEVEAPVVVVEVLSPTTATRDLRDKLSGYFRCESVEHYLIVDPDRRSVIHHKRGAGDLIETRILSSGSLRLDPPGVNCAVEDFFDSQ